MLHVKGAHSQKKHGRARSYSFPHLHPVVLHPLAAPLTLLYFLDIACSADQYEQGRGNTGAGRWGCHHLLGSMVFLFKYKAQLWFVPTQKTAMLAQWHEPACCQCQIQFLCWLEQVRLLWAVQGWDRGVGGSFHCGKGISGQDEDWSWKGMVSAGSGTVLEGDGISSGSTCYILTPAPEPRSPAWKSLNLSYDVDDVLIHTV